MLAYSHQPPNAFATRRRQRRRPRRPTGEPLGGDHSPLPPLADRKLLLVLFGGGTRSSESIDDPEHRYIPRLWKEMIPRGTLWTNMRVEHRVVHPNCNASIKTGHWEYDDLDWSKPPGIPPSSRSCAKQRGLPDTAAWSFVYASILANTGRSSAAGYGDRFAANVVEPPTIPRTAAEEMERLLAAARATGSPRGGNESRRPMCPTGPLDQPDQPPPGCNPTPPAAGSTSTIGRGGEGTGTTSHDAFLADLALACMKRFSPHVMSVDFGEIDCAHYGSWSRYVEAIRRTDQLTWRLWRAVETLPGYRGKTLMLVLPDHGRELDEPGPNGFHPPQRFLHGPRGRRRLPPGLDAGPRAGRSSRGKRSTGPCRSPRPPPPGCAISACVLRPTPPRQFEPTTP